MAQYAPTTQWQRTFGGSNDDEAHAVRQTSDTGYIVVGRSKSNNDQVTGNHGGFDYWIVKLDSLGNLKWQKSIGGSGDDCATDVQQTTDGGYIVGGYSNSTDHDVTNNHGGYDYWIVKLDANGNISWENSFGGSGDDEATGMQQTTDGGFIIGGFSNSTDHDVTGNHGGYDFWVVKLNSSGSLTWEQSYGGSGDEEASALQQTTDGGYFIGGYSQSNDQDVSGHHGSVDSADYWVVQLNSSGILLWQKSLGGSGVDKLLSLEQISDGGYILAGSSDSRDGDVGAAYNGFRIWWLPRLATDGSIRGMVDMWGTGWPNGLLVNPDSISISIRQTDFGGFVDAEFADSIYVAPGYITKYYSIKENDRFETFDFGGWQDRLFCIRQTFDHGFIAAGYSIPPDGTTTAQHGAHDFYLIKIGVGYYAQISSAKKFAFDTLACGSTIVDSLVVYNAGDVPLKISAAAILGQNPGAVSIVSPTFPVTIQLGDSLKVVLQFSASTIGTVLDTLSLTTNDTISVDSPWKISLVGRKDIVALALPDSTIMRAMQAGGTADTIVIFKTTGTLADTITNVQQISGVQWITFQMPTLPHAVPAAVSNDTAQLRFHFNAPRDTGWFAAQFKIHIEPCGIDSVITIRVHVVSGILSATNAKIFSPIVCQSTQCDSFMLHNTGNGPLMIASAQLRGNDSVMFNALSPAPPLTIAPNDSVTMHVCFHLRTDTTGDFISSIVVKSNDSISTSNIFSIALSARKDSSFLAAAPVLLDVGSVCVGTTVCAFEQVAAFGTIGDTIIGANKISGSAAFSVTSPAFPFSIASGASQEINICFTPPDTGNFQTTFSIVSQPCNRTTSFTVAGRGVQSGITALDTVLDFGNVHAQSTKYATARFIVSGAENFSISSIVLAPSLVNFAIDSTQPANLSTIQPGDTVTLFLSFFPPSAQSDSTFIEVMMATPCGINPYIRVYGRGVSGNLVSDRSAMDFGKFICATTTKLDSVLITNTGSEILTVNLSLTGVDAGDFSILNPAPFIMSPASSQEIFVRCAPAFATTPSATLEIQSNDSLGNVAVVHVALSARLDTLGCSIAGAVNDTLDFGTLPLGVAKDGTLTIINTSTIGTQFTLRNNAGAIFFINDSSIVFSNAGDQHSLTVHFAGATQTGFFSGMMILTDACGHADTIYLKATVDSMAFEISALRDTTICPNDSTLRRVMVFNPTAITQTLHVSGSAPLFSITPDSLVLGAGDSAVLTILFFGSPSAGTYNAQFFLADNNDVHRAMNVVVNVNAGAITARAISDTSICPGLAATRRVMLRNTGNADQQLQLNGGGLFAIAPGNFLLRAGDSATVQIIFAGTETAGTYTMHTPLPGCDSSHELAATINVVVPKIIFSMTQIIAACPLENIIATVTFTNGDSIERHLHFTSSTGALSHSDTTLAAGASDKVQITIAGLPAGRDTCVVHAVDDCGVMHDATIVIIAGAQPPIDISISADTISSAIGVERGAYLLASSFAPLSGAPVSFTITNEPTALQFDSASFPCGANIVAGANTVAITIPACASYVSDTLGMVYYKTLVGSTLHPEIHLQNVSSVSACDTARGDGVAIFSLLPAGCELGTVNVFPYTSGIQSMFPNPATGITTITYSTIEQATVQIELHDALGRIMQTLVDAMHAPGQYATTFDSRTMTEGIYFLQLREGEFCEMREVVVVK